MARELLDAVSEALFAAGTAGLQEDVPPGEATRPRQPWEEGPEPPAPRQVLVRAWFEDPDRAEVGGRLAELAPGAELRWSVLADTPWEEAWKEDHRPLVVGRLTVAPPWNAPPGALVIDPGQGFGTGHHPTTRAVLEELQELAPAVAAAGPGEGPTLVLDVGSGSGILALAAARLGLTARGVEVDAEAVREARANARRNRLDVGFASTPVADLEEGAPLVLANLHAEALLALAPELLRLTGRWLVVSGVPASSSARRSPLEAPRAGTGGDRGGGEAPPANQGVLLDREERVRAALAGLRVERRRVDDERWVTLVLAR